MRALLSLSLLALACTEEGFAPEADPSQSHVIYGVDDRIEYYQITDAAVRAAADATVALMDSSYLTRRGSSWDIWTGSTLRTGAGVCSSEPYANQPDPGFCSGVMIGSDLIATAGHCVSTSDCRSTRFVFGFRLDSAGDVRDTVSQDDVYSCSSIVARSTGNADYAVVRVDRPIVGRSAVPIRRSGTVASNAPLILMGHPGGIPFKAAGGGTVKGNSAGSYFSANLDSYTGNSGSPVFNANTLEVEGILVRGNDDWDWTGSCYVSNVCSSTNGCPGFEDATRTTEFDQHVPALTGGGGGGTTGCTDDGFENNDSTSAAALLVDGSYTDLEICGVGDPDYYRVDLAAGQTLTVTLDFTHSAGDIDLALYQGATRVGLSEGTTNSEQLSWTASTATTLTVHVYGYDGAENAYDLTVDVSGGAPTPTGDFALSGLPTVTRGAWYTFSLTDGPAEEQVQLHVGRAGGSTAVSGCPGLDLDLDNSRVVGSPWTDALGATTVTVQVPANAAPGTYAFQAAAPDACTVSNLHTVTVQ